MNNPRWLFLVFSGPLLLFILGVCTEAFLWRMCVLIVELSVLSLRASFGTSAPCKFKFKSPLGTLAFYYKHDRNMMLWPLTFSESKFLRRARLTIICSIWPRPHTVVFPKYITETMPLGLTRININVCLYSECILYTDCRYAHSWIYAYNTIV